MASFDSKLKSIYYSASDPGAYGGVEPLFRRARAKCLKVNRNQVREFLEKQHTYTIHKPARKHFLRNKTVVGGIDRQWQADLADMQDLAEDNDGYRYILTVIDCFSRYGWAIPVKSKSANDMVEGFNKLFKKSKPRIPQKLQTDKGKEFFNKYVKELLKNKGIELFASNSPMKAAMVERFNRTIKTKLWRYFTASHTNKYIDVLPNIIESYNKSPHRMLGMCPNEVRAKHENKLWTKFYGSPIRNVKVKLKKGDNVRLSKIKGDFEKGYLPNWTEEKFYVNSVQPEAVYKLKDKMDTDIQGIFYPEEIQKVHEKEEVFKIKKVVKQRTVKGKKEFLVTWQDWPDKFNSWLTQEEFDQYRNE